MVTSQKKPQWTTLIMIDSLRGEKHASMLVRSLKSFVSTNARFGVKRPLAVDILGFPFFTHCTKASLSDDLQAD